MSTRNRKTARVCPHQGAFLLDNWLRRLIQPPHKLLRGLIKPGDTIVDVGCGPGHFTLPMARLTGPGGRVLAVDLQIQMLDHVRRKAQRCGLSDRIACHLCRPEAIGLTLTADFILAWYMVHETPDPAAFFREVRTLLKRDGRLLVVEPQMHVSRNAFDTMLTKARACGLIEQAPFKSLLSRGVLLALA